VTEALAVRVIHDRAMASYGTFLAACGYEYHGHLLVGEPEGRTETGGEAGVKAVWMRAWLS
jgi:hypothetical protein